jgi:hypothetical protein
MARFMIAHLQEGHLGDFDMLDRGTARLMHSPSETCVAGVWDHGARLLL